MLRRRARVHTPEQAQGVAMIAPTTLGVLKPVKRRMYHCVSNLDPTWRRVPAGGNCRSG